MDKPKSKLLFGIYSDSRYGDKDILMTAMRSNYAEPFISHIDSIISKAENSATDEEKKKLYNIAFSEVSNTNTDPQLKRLLVERLRVEIIVLSAGKMTHTGFDSYPGNIP